MGTSCIYPKFAKTPIKESQLLTGILEKTNQSYAIAKIAGIKLCEALYEDYKLNIICLMPTNVYGENDNFNKINGHVIPAMISKFETVKKKIKINFLLGSGKPLREFIHAEDLASAIYFMLKNKENSLISKKFKKKLPIFNIGTKNEISIKKLAKLIALYIGFKGNIIFDKKSPDGLLEKV